MSADQLELVARWRADGAVRNLVLNLPAFKAGSKRYAITAELDRVGLAAVADLPGIRGFSGSLRADQDSGLLAIATRNATLDLGAWVPEAVELDNIDGTLIWRRSGDRMTVLSDSITVRNAVLDSQSSIEIVLERETPPRVDVNTSFSISDIAVAKRFIPQRIMPEKLHRWFQDALVKGTVSKGEAHLSGELERFPFNSGGGRFFLKATANDAVLRYLPSFPPSLLREAEVVLENTHLYSRQNRSTNQGNLTVNARVDIRNLLEPVLEIKGRSTGTLATIADFADKSPIAEVFGGQLGRVTLGGNASLDLDLLVPIRDWTAFEFTALIASKDGSLAVAGLNPPLTGVSGNVTVSKDSIASEDLTGIFLGEPVAIELENAPPDQPAYRVVANATGAASATAIVAAFELPLADRLSGTLAYEAQLLFPRGGQEPPVGFSVELQSDLSGLRSDLPAPLDKAADSSWPVQAGVTFEPGGELIRTTGSAESKFDWQISFARTAERWDFDRGVVAFGQGKRAP
jgi:uncharacterized protein YhdP